MCVCFATQRIVYLGLRNAVSTPGPQKELEIGGSGRPAGRDRLAEDSSVVGLRSLYAL